MSPDDFAAKFDVSRETRDQLTIFANLLKRWNRRINLVSGSTLPDVWVRHIADSAQLVALAPGQSSWLDLGSGAGFPGLVVAALAPQASVTLIESDQRKAVFLRTAAAEMGLSVTVHAVRIEDAPAMAPDVISARALAPLPRLLPLSARFARPDTVLLFPKGASADSELTEAHRTWHTKSETFPSMTDPTGVILRIRDVRPRHAEP